MNYEKTVRGKIRLTHRNMRVRVSTQPRYVGLDICDKDDFMSWTLASKDFMPLYDKWSASNYDRRLTPSIDRIDPSKGYTFDNMRWLSLSENSSLADKPSKYGVPKYISIRTNANKNPLWGYKRLVNGKQVWLNTSTDLNEVIDFKTKYELS